MEGGRVKLPRTQVRALANLYLRDVSHGSRDSLCDKEHGLLQVGYGGEEGAGGLVQTQLELEEWQAGTAALVDGRIVLHSTCQ